MGLAGIGLNLLMGYAGLVSLGSAAFMSMGAFSAYNLLLRAAWLPLPLALIVAGRHRRRSRAWCSACPASASRASISPPRRSARSSSSSGCSPASLVLQQQPDADDLRAASRVLRHRSALGAGPLPAGAGHHRGPALARPQHRAQPDRPRLDGDPRHGQGGGGDRHPVAKRKLLAYAISSFFAGIAGALCAFAYLGTARCAFLRSRQVVRGAVHRPDRRIGQPVRQLPRCRLHRADTDRAHPRSPKCWA